MGFKRVYYSKQSVDSKSDSKGEVHWEGSFLVGRGEGEALLMANRDWHRSAGSQGTVAYSSRWVPDLSAAWPVAVMPGVYSWSLHFVCMPGRALHSYYPV